MPKAAHPSSWLRLAHRHFKPRGLDCGMKKENTQGLWQWWATRCIFSLAVLKGIVSVNRLHECLRPRFPMGVAENLYNWLGVSQLHLFYGLLVVSLPDSLQRSRQAVHYFSIASASLLIHATGDAMLPRFPCRGVCCTWSVNFGNQLLRIFAPELPRINKSFKNRAKCGQNTGFYSSQRQPQNFENVTLVARRREHFWVFWRSFWLLDSLQKRYFSTQESTRFLSTESRMLPFKQ